ncbi:MAG TPA: DUF937 domain-containing protein [Thermoanaerobaculia bacterium]|nr:DUF937 domain-containing protein [Thermoanaerobaculia bacterium]
MSLVDILSSQLGTEGVEKLGQQLGLDPATTQQAVSAAIPMLTGALAHNAAQPGGADALHQALDAHDGSILDEIGGYLGNSGVASSMGGAILGHILGQHQDNATTGLANATGIDAGQAGQLLSTLAPLVLGALGRMKQQQGIDPGDLAGVLQNEHAQAEAAAPSGLGGLAQILLGGGGSGGGGGLGDIAGSLLGGLFGGKR